ncbi:MAG: hypothetical protein ABSA26_17260 [Thermoguttaceae bacterium]|jgi:hypothetical protein
MFLTLLGVTFAIALAVSFIVSRIFKAPLDAILRRIVSEDISAGWLKYLMFAIYVVGISSGVRIYELEKYITPARWDTHDRIIEITGERWVLEVYRTIIETLQGIAWVLLAFFVYALLAYVIIKVFEIRKPKEIRDKTP